MNSTYKQHYPDHNKYWEEIAAEIQCFGANTFATIFRGGKGVLYKEVLVDVCGKLKVNFNKNSDVKNIENCLLMKILSDALESMSPEEIKALGGELGIKNTSGLTSQTLSAAFQTIFRAGGFKSYQLTLIIVNQVMKALIGRGLSLAANASLMRVMSVLTGPIGWAITGIWTAVDIGSAAYRVTIPAVIQVAFLRTQLSAVLADEISFE
ncbi:ubiquinol-cytochrome C chaperone family protein [Xenorhabdus sp. SGI240]|uniref:YaaW family protein n=1 Tax=Xenorhabdus sp. SGI240 TaxID=3158262 RepID=UPI0032B80B4A